MSTLRIDASRRYASTPLRDHEQEHHGPLQRHGTESMHAGTFCERYAGGMRGGLQRWKRGVSSQGVQQAVAYAFGGSCDSHLHTAGGVDALGHYSDVTVADVQRFMATADGINVDTLNQAELAAWVDGRDPQTGERRGRELNRPDADLVLDGTINAPKSFSLAALINDDLATEFEALQDRLRERVIRTWQRELNARRGAGGAIREGIAQLEVVELQHRRSRALDPHIHRHLWLNVRVQGDDGRWSNLDSRVAMKLHTVINAEGEVASRTDPEWIAALARNGYSLNESGEIAELAHAVRPLSRRSNQIEANRAMRLAQWRAENPGLEPSPDVLLAIDRWAWAHGRPNKPANVDEDEWEQRTRAELADIDPAILKDREPITTEPTQIADLDRDLLAARAVVDADKRASATGGRYSLFDLRAGALRAIAASGVVADRDLLTEVAEDVVERAQLMSVDVLVDETEIPGHIKHMISSDTAAAKIDLAEAFDRLNTRGRVARDVVTAKAAEKVLGEDVALDEAQASAASAIAGTHGLVTVTGPAGTGKTTLLRVARAALEAKGRRMVVVAPTKKAASVAGREVGASAGSLHALLFDHGWRWGTDETGATAWSKLEVGDVDPRTGDAYSGPRQYLLNARDRIVVDEAGMVDLEAAVALADVAERTGAGIAMVGDHLQARPVGHSGAMAMMKQRSGAVVELSAVHRFTDRTYADLSLRLREPADAAAATAVAWELYERGQLRVVGSEDEARARMVDEYLHNAAQGRRVALVTSTNAEAQQINETIQAALVRAGKLSDTVVAVGQDEQRLLIGDVVQTRRNDSETGVENRAMWRIRRIEGDTIELASLSDSTDVRQVHADYAATHLHLAYASTVHGIQGETTDDAIVGPGVDAAGLYVGMTRGRRRNEAIVIAQNAPQAIGALSETMLRGKLELTITDATGAARDELSRAARAPRDAPSVPSWDDRNARPLGAIVNLDRYHPDAPERAAELAKQVERLGDLLDRTRTTLGEMRARLSTVEANDHAAEATGQQSSGDAPPLALIYERMSAQYEERSAQYRELRTAHGKAVRLADRVAAERAIREALPTEQLAAEAAARLEHMKEAVATRQRSTDTGMGPSI